MAAPAARRSGSVSISWARCRSISRSAKPPTRAARSPCRSRIRPTRRPSATSPPRSGKKSRANPPPAARRPASSSSNPHPTPSFLGRERHPLAWGGRSGQRGAEPPEWRDGFAATAARPGRAAAAAAAHRGAVAGVLRLGRARVLVLRRVCAAGAGRCDSVDLCRAVDPRIRLVAHGALRRGVFGRRVGGDLGAADRALARPARLAAGAVRRGARQRHRAVAAVRDRVAVALLSAVLLGPDELGRAVRSRHLRRIIKLVCAAAHLRDIDRDIGTASWARRDAASRAIRDLATGLARGMARDRRGDIADRLCAGLAVAGAPARGSRLVARWGPRGRRAERGGRASACGRAGLFAPRGIAYPGLLARLALYGAGVPGA